MHDLLPLDAQHILSLFNSHSQAVESPTNCFDMIWYALVLQCDWGRLNLVLRGVQKYQYRGFFLLSPDLPFSRPRLNGRRE